MAQITPSSVLANLEQDITADWKHYHGAAHVKQFLGLFAAAFVTAVAAAGWHVAGRGVLAGLVLGAAGAAVRQMWPQVPWPVVKSALAEAKSLADRPTTPPPVPVKPTGG